MGLVTAHFIAGEHIFGNGRTFWAEMGSTGKSLQPAFPEANESIVEQACQAACSAFPVYRALPLHERAALLESIADELDADVEQFVARTPMETGLPEARVRGELARTTHQLRLFASVVRSGDFLGVRIDTANPNRQPMPKPDIRQYRAPLGPVVVFGASNFPLAFSVAGGDTASALAAGCPVIVKAHPAHPGTSAIAAAAIERAVEHSRAPAGVFSLLQGRSHDVGVQLVLHPAVKAIGFTGSFGGGTALARLAAERPEPIPVYAEMGSVNPMFLLPDAVAERTEAIAAGYVGSMTLGCGQFCTNPGLVIAVSGEALERFIDRAAQLMTEAPAGLMLNSGILAGYEAGVERLNTADAVELIAKGLSQEHGAQARLYRTRASTIEEIPHLLEEVFGPAGLIIEVADASELVTFARKLPGQLTASVHGTSDELPRYPELIATLEDRAGRVLFNGYPTGVEVCHAMVHGGPFPATTDPGMTSVGTLAIDRFLRPVCYQDCPQSMLPEPLRDDNPLQLRRLVNGRWCN